MKKLILTAFSALALVACGGGDEPAADTTADEPHVPPLVTTANCVLDAKVCPDGTVVGRKLPSCQFEACPSSPGSSLGPLELIPSK